MGITSASLYMSGNIPFDIERLVKECLLDRLLSLASGETDVLEPGLEIHHSTALAFSWWLPSLIP